MTQSPNDLIPQNPAELAVFLEAAGLDLSGWGRGSAKTVENLFSEITLEECRIQIDPLRRIVDVVSVLIQRDGRILIEAAQALEGGRLRHRELLPSEKIKRGELPRLGAIRCLHEELGLRPDQFQLAEAPFQIEKKEEESNSYPGLISSYRFYTYEAAAPTLPDRPFETDEHGEGNPVERNYWRWEKID